MGGWPRLGREQDTGTPRPHGDTRRATWAPRGSGERDRGAHAGENLREHLLAAQMGNRGPEREDSGQESKGARPVWLNG